MSRHDPWRHDHEAYWRTRMEARMVPLRHEEVTRKEVALRKEAAREHQLGDDEPTQPGVIDNPTRAHDYVRTLKPGMTISDAVSDELGPARILVPGLLARRYMYLERTVFGYVVCQLDPP